MKMDTHTHYLSDKSRVCQTKSFQYKRKKVDTLSFLLHNNHTCYKKGENVKNGRKRKI